MKIGLEVQSKAFIKQLGKSGSRLQQVAANTLNESAEEIRGNYNRRLKKGKSKVRTTFTTNASRTLKSNPIRSSGEPRQLNQINSKLVVRKMKGGKDHYLLKREKGGTTRGNRLTRGKVPIPLASSRISGSDNKVVARGNRLTTSRTQVLKAGGKPFGVKGDKRQNGKPWISSGQRFAALYTYHSKLKGNSRKIQGDLKKPFFFIDNSNKLGIFKFKGKRVRKIRNLEKSTVRRKAKPSFKNAVNDMKPRRIQEKFVKNAKKVVQVRW